ncbi:uncharacterized protein LOC112410801 isoform X2 [Neophocaena asiaeorientalis asiaeorientalis]|uniref:Uncharacterized protein LOC112410801 isoform X2 n=1 Tax=Neophocaena asiaeorientalis asiaeorientalis TaxID=1706337 RepID=A0A341CR63_NEOAA|nr:uncharacterized protein LOC112410801 isoform X2 [Neophocaena asiaeorientalis asiaeorientalis]
MARGWSPEEPESCQFQGAGPGPSLQISLPRFSASNEQLQGPGVAAQLDSQHTPLILTMAPGPGRGPITAEKIKAGTAANVKEHEAREMPGTAPAEQQRRVHGTFLLLSLLPSLRPLPWTWEPAWVEMLLTVTLSRRTPGPIISALRPNKNQSQSPSRRRPQGKVRAPARQTQQKRSHPSQPGKQRIVSKGKEEPQLSSGQWQDQRGKEGPTTQSPTPSTRLQLQPKSFWHYLFGGLRETREKEKRGTTALHSAEIPKSQKDGPLLWTPLSLEAAPWRGSRRTGE